MRYLLLFGLFLPGVRPGWVPKGTEWMFSGKTVPPTGLFNPANARIRNPKVQAEDCDSASGMKRIAVETATVMGDARHGAYLLFRQVDLKNVEKLTYRLAAPHHAAALRLHLNSPNGPVVSTLHYDKTGSDTAFAESSAPVSPSPGVYDLYFVVTGPNDPDADLLRLDWIYFHRKTTALPRLGG